VADNSSRADFIAADMIAQLEHGPDSAAIVITTNELAKKIPQEIETQLEGLPRKEIVLASLKNSAILTTEFACNEDIVKVASAINNYAPEHLEIQTGKAIERRLMKLVKNAGAVFLGENSCEAFGDYCAGSNHVLPTGGSARFSSGLSVASFTKIIEVVQDFTPKIGVLSKNTAVLARAEGLEGHARSAKKREIKR
ncbi:histidinol dehydrogenase, partial [Candidatus Parvarchaeota archaeon]|nr:histidinol dehydrogenase [Candidatus Parvarchaeota archaeon]